MNPILAAALTAIVVFLPIYMGYRFGAYRREAELVPLFAAPLREATDEAAKVSALLAAETERANNEHRRRVEVVEMIAEIEKERNVWKGMYFSAGAEYGAAQAMLLRELGRLSMLCKKHKIPKAEVSEALMKVVNEVAGRHPPPSHGPETQSMVTAGAPIAETPPATVDSPST